MMYEFDDVTCSEMSDQYEKPVDILSSEIPEEFPEDDFSEGSDYGFADVHDAEDCNETCFEEDGPSDGIGRSPIDFERGPELESTINPETVGEMPPAMQATDSRWDELADVPFAGDSAFEANEPANKTSWGDLAGVPFAGETQESAYDALSVGGDSSETGTTSFNE